MEHVVMCASWLFTYFVIRIDGTLICIYCDRRLWTKYSIVSVINISLYEHPYPTISYTIK